LQEPLLDLIAVHQLPLILCLPTGIGYAFTACLFSAPFHLTMAQSS
jgi:hypothetical protein